MCACVCVLVCVCVCVCVCAGTCVCWGVVERVPLFYMRVVLKFIPRTFLLYLSISSGATLCYG